MMQTIIFTILVSVFSSHLKAVENDGKLEIYSNMVDGSDFYNAGLKVKKMPSLVVPRSAIRGDIQGFCLLRFDVGLDGKPIKKSIKYIAQYPRYMFCRNSRNDLEKFIFEGRRNYKITSVVHGQSYMFSYCFEKQCTKKYNDIFKQVGFSRKRQVQKTPILDTEVTPKYPLKALRKKVEGSCDFSAIVRPDGSVLSGSYTVTNEQPKKYNFCKNMRKVIYKYKFRGNPSIGRITKDTLLFFKYSFYLNK